VDRETKKESVDEMESGIDSDHDDAERRSSVLHGANQHWASTAPPHHATDAGSDTDITAAAAAQSSHAALARHTSSSSIDRLIDSLVLRPPPPLPDPAPTPTTTTRCRGGVDDVLSQLARAPAASPSRRSDDDDNIYANLVIPPPPPPPQAAAAGDDDDELRAFLAKISACNGVASARRRPPHTNSKSCSDRSGTTASQPPLHAAVAAATTTRVVDAEWRSVHSRHRRDARVDNDDYNDNIHDNSGNNYHNDNNHDNGINNDNRACDADDDVLSTGFDHSSGHHAAQRVDSGGTGEQLLHRGNGEPPLQYHQQAATLQPRVTSSHRTGQQQQSEAACSAVSPERASTSASYAAQHPPSLSSAGAWSSARRPTAETHHNATRTHQSLTTTSTGQ